MRLEVPLWLYSFFLQLLIIGTEQSLPILSPLISMGIVQSTLMGSASGSIICTTSLRSQINISGIDTWKTLMFPTFSTHLVLPKKGAFQNMQLFAAVLKLKYYINKEAGGNQPNTHVINQKEHICRLTEYKCKLNATDSH